MLAWWTGLTFPLYMSPSDFPPDCVLQPQKVARNQWLMICTDLLTFTLDGLEKCMMQEFLEIPLSTHKGISETLFPEWKKSNCTRGSSTCGT